MFDPREPTPMFNRSLSDRSPWRCDECGAIHESMDDPGARTCFQGVVKRVCWKHIRPEDAGGNHDGE